MKFKFSKTFFIQFKVLILFAFISCGNNNRNETSEIENVNLPRPNILWIVVDDLGLDLGCYGESMINTPNLDTLASQGMKYTNLHTVAAVCSVSRSALITGMYPVSIGCEQHRTQFKDSLPKPVRPITEFFKEAGYFVTNKGKTDYNFIHNKDSLFNGDSWNQRKNGQPFFSQIQISLPHRPFKSDSLHPIDADRVKLPPYYPDHPLARKDWAMYLETIQIMDIQVGTILTKLKKDGLDKNTIVFFFGDQGRPHVRAKQFLYEDGIRTPLIIRWPGKLKRGTNDRLISNLDLAPTVLKVANITPPDYMQGKGFIDKDAIPRKFIYGMRDRRDETVDRIRMIKGKRFKYIRNFYPERPYTQFNAYKKNFYPMLTLMQVMYKKGKLTPDQARFFSDTRPEEELYDLKSDPFELQNLANLKNYQNEKSELRKHLTKWLENVDLGTYPEDPVEIKSAEKLMTELFKKQMKAKGLRPSISDEEYLKYWEKQLLGK